MRVLPYERDIIKGEAFKAKKRIYQIFHQTRKNTQPHFEEFIKACQELNAV